MKGLMLCLLALTFLYGCNTVEGLGEDLEAGGKKIQEEAEERKRASAVRWDMQEFSRSDDITAHLPDPLTRYLG